MASSSSFSSSSSASAGGSTHYDVLGVSRTATLKEIKAAYKRLALCYHPDTWKFSAKATRESETDEPGEVGQHADERGELARNNLDGPSVKETSEEAQQQAAEEHFRRITRAYEVLCNDAKRQRYDADHPLFDGGPDARQGHWTSATSSNPFFTAENSSAGGGRERVNEQGDWEWSQAPSSSSSSSTTTSSSSLSFLAAHQARMEASRRFRTPNPYRDGQFAATARAQEVESQYVGLGGAFDDPSSPSAPFAQAEHEAPSSSSSSSSSSPPSSSSSSSSFSSSSSSSMFGEGGSRGKRTNVTTGMFQTSRSEGGSRYVDPSSRSNHQHHQEQHSNTNYYDRERSPVHPSANNDHSYQHFTNRSQRKAPDPVHAARSSRTVSSQGEGERGNFSLGGRGITVPRPAPSSFSPPSSSSSSSSSFRGGMQYSTPGTTRTIVHNRGATRPGTGSLALILSLGVGGLLALSSSVSKRQQEEGWRLAREERMMKRSRGRS